MPTMAEMLYWSAAIQFDDTRTIEDSSNYQLVFGSFLASGALGAYPLVVTHLVYKVTHDSPSTDARFVFDFPTPFINFNSGASSAPYAWQGIDDDSFSSANADASAHNPSYRVSSWFRFEPNLSAGGSLRQTGTIDVCTDPSCPPVTISGVGVAAIYKDLGFNTPSLGNVDLGGPTYDSDGGSVSFTPTGFVGTPNLAVPVFYAVDTLGGGTPSTVTMENASGWEDAVWGTSSADRGALLGLWFAGGAGSTTFTGGPSGSSYQYAFVLGETGGAVSSAAGHFFQIIG